MRQRSTTRWPLAARLRCPSARPQALALVVLVALRRGPRTGATTLVHGREEEPVAVAVAVVNRLTTTVLSMRLRRRRPRPLPGGEVPPRLSLPPARQRVRVLLCGRTCDRMRT